MRRIITDHLIQWKEQPNHKPLLMRGARQVGKTWSILDFGKNHFNGNVHMIDFEKHPEWHSLFQKNLDVKRILSELEILLNISIEPGKDLLFFDEIQTCPKALMSLRYFYEDLPELHIIAAGSLLEFALKDISFPVGRIHMMQMYPLNFIEFLSAMEQTRLAELLTDPPQRLSDTAHHTLLEQLRLYFFIGGMPECVLRYKERERFLDVFEVQVDLIDTFRQDFSKYTPMADKHCLNTVLTSVARNVGRQIKYARLADGFSQPTIKKAFTLLSLAQLFHKVSSVNIPEIPFGASALENIFKTVFLDIGLMQQVCNIPVQTEFAKANLLSIYEGAMAEQFVGQELLTAGTTPLYYWSRNAKSSTAEVDYLLAQNGVPVPVEVKSGTAGRLRSLHLFLKQHHRSPGGIVLSSSPYAKLTDQKLTFLPLFYAYSLGINQNDPVE